MIIFTGVAGSGKSLQGKLLADELGYPWLSTGEFLRMVISGERRRHMLEGNLLGDDEIIAVVEKIFTMINTQEEFVLDGFPRTTKQAEWLLGLSSAGKTTITAVIHLEASKQVVQERLLARGRRDDHEAAIAERFSEYEESIKPILATFEGAGVTVVDINAERSKEAIHQEILGLIKDGVRR